MICLRCGRGYDTPFPEVTNVEGIEEIFTKEWCADCNSLIKFIFRDRSAYDVSPNVKGSRKVSDGK